MGVEGRRQRRDHLPFSLFLFRQECCLFGVLTFHVIRKEED